MAKNEFVAELEGKYFSELDKKLQEQFLNTPISIASIKVKKIRGKYIIEKVSVNYTIESLVRKYKDGEIVLPLFQRGKVWNDKKKSELIYSLFTLAIPELITYEGEGGILYLLDGWQRLSTIIDFAENNFKLKFDEKIEHINPKKTNEAEILKNLFERINYQSTPLSQYRIVLLSIYTLSDIQGKKNLERIENNINHIQFLAKRIKEHSPSEKNLGFVERVLSAYSLMKMFDEQGEANKVIDEIKETSKKLSDVLITTLKPVIWETGTDKFAELTDRIYELGYILSNEQVSRLLGKEIRYAEPIGIMLYLLEKQGLLNNNLIEQGNYEAIQTKANDILNAIDRILSSLEVKNPTITKKVSIYLNTLGEIYNIYKDLDVKDIVEEKPITVNQEEIVEENTQNEESVEVENKEELKEENMQQYGEMLS